MNKALIIQKQSQSNYNYDQSQIPLTLRKQRSISYRHLTKQNNHTISPRHQLTISPRHQLNKEYKNTFRQPLNNFLITQTNRSTQINSELNHESESLNIRINYLEQQNKQLKRQNFNLTIQKRKLNQNYVEFLAAQEQNSYKQSSTIEILKIKHFQEIQTLKKMYAKKDHQYNQRIKLLQTSFATLKVYNSNLQNQIKVHQQDISNQIFENDKAKNQIKFIQNQHLKVKNQLIVRNATLQQQISSNQKTISQLFTKINSIQTQLKINIDKNKQIQTQIHLLLQIQNQHTKQIQTKKQLLQQYSKQITCLKEINHQWFDKYQHIRRKYQFSQKKLIQTQYSIKNIKQQDQNHIKQLDKNIKQQNQNHIKQIDKMKQRQLLMIQSEANNRNSFSLTINRKNQQIDDLIKENQRLYRQINKLKFQTIKNHQIY